MRVAKVPQRCGARTGAGKPCRLPVRRGTSRCWRHQGEWTAGGRLLLLQKELKEAKEKLIKSRKK
ncbi:hypothetical protein GCM10018779_07010 [Streptomyces griseocarneus]|nr:hypothetical protein GCM10018779_07010 [Streptomyces griseocarneus]